MFGWSQNRIANLWLWASQTTRPALCSAPTRTHLCIGRSPGVVIASHRPSLSLSRESGNKRSSILMFPSRIACAWAGLGALYGGVQSRRDTDRILRPFEEIKMLNLPSNFGFFTKNWTPSVGRDGERYRFDLGQERNGKFLQTGLDTS